MCDTIVFKSLFEFCGRVTWFVADGECTIKDLSFLGLDGAVSVTSSIRSSTNSAYVQL